MTVNRSSLDPVIHLAILIAHLQMSISIPCTSLIRSSITTYNNKDPVTQLMHRAKQLSEVTLWRLLDARILLGNVLQSEFDLTNIAFVEDSNVPPDIMTRLPCSHMCITVDQQPRVDRPRQ